MIGILGGSFDPVHDAHLAMADAFAEALDLHEVRFLPAARPWQKHGLAANAAERLAMLELALGHHRPARGRYVVDTRELARDGDTYTIDTLAALRDELGPDTSLAFLFGADQLVHLDTWHDWPKLWDYAHLAAVTRPRFNASLLPRAVAHAWSSRLGDADALRTTPSGRSFLLETLALDVSATDIRAALPDAARQDEARRMVPPTVLDYIRAKHLYRS
jgi:nicotinate-nucleotide adenylyltransferase